MPSYRRSPVRLLVAALAVVATTAPFGATPASAGYADAAISTASVTVPMVFPVIGPTSYSDTFLACRSGCTRKHFGQDLMGPRMRLAVAVFNGYVQSIKRETTVGEGNYITIKGDNGWSANYIHMNNDTPGTDDGRGTANYFLAPGIHEGSRVFAGQFIAYTGDSGNAESTGPHVHFELRKGDPWSGTVYNAFPSLNAARRLTKPTTSGPHPQGSYVKGCATTCPVWQIDRGYRRLVRPEVAKELAVTAAMAVPITLNELTWYRRGTDVPLPGGRAYRGPDGTVWFVVNGRRIAVPSTAALTPLGIPAARVRTTTSWGLATVPRAAEGTLLPTNVFYNGALLRVPGSTTAYWYVVKGERRRISDAMTLKSWGLADADAITIPPPPPPPVEPVEPVEGAEGAEVVAAPLVLPPLGTYLPLKDGAVIRDTGGRKYVVSNGLKRPFMLGSVYAGYGYTPVLVQAASGAVLYRLPTGAAMP